MDGGSDKVGRFKRKNDTVLLGRQVSRIRTREVGNPNKKKGIRTLKNECERVNKKKCNFAKDAIEYLDHVILGAGVLANPKKIEAMWKWPTPKDVTVLRGCLGLVGYFRRFVQGYRTIVKPLTQLLRKDAFQCAKENQQAFTILKKALSCLPTLVEFWFNTNYNTFSQMTPFKVLYGCDSSLILKGTTIPSKAARDAISKELKENLCEAQEKNKLQANKDRRDVVYNEGDWVFLRIQPYRLKSLSQKRNEKLSPRYYGLIKSWNELGSHEFGAIRSTCTPYAIYFHMFAKYMVEVTLEKLLDICQNATSEMEVLLKWKQLPESENSWESADVITIEFLSFHLEDKVKLQGRAVFPNHVVELGCQVDVKLGCRTGMSS
ncbi:hypothetical protein V8G54_015190 [Vigna mungo]|uniref:Chromo domain-containing protein n=1 Tax=Vigna mungo TaxID=3915 RepID=A0AAQ3NKR8_VIGMU